MGDFSAELARFEAELAAVGSAPQHMPQSHGYSQVQNQAHMLDEY